ncbi:MAG: hypothetical protein ACI9C1_003282 [Candidatus Aldehydirespiratoraceae bacterium]|jgi:hypothetical protein
MRWSTLPAAGLALLAVGCGRGYEDENRSIVSELPALEKVVLLDEDHYGFCSGDSCPFGNDGSGALLMYSVDTDGYSQASLADAYRVGLSGWDATIEEGCANADPSITTGHQTDERDVCRCGTASSSDV